MYVYTYVPSRLGSAGGDGGGDCKCGRAGQGTLMLMLIIRSRSFYIPVLDAMPSILFSFFFPFTILKDVLKGLLSIYIPVLHTASTASISRRLSFESCFPGA